MPAPLWSSVYQHQPSLSLPKLKRSTAGIVGHLEPQSPAGDLRPPKNGSYSRSRPARMNSCIERNDFDQSISVSPG